MSIRSPKFAPGDQLLVPAYKLLTDRPKGENGSYMAYSYSSSRMQVQVVRITVPLGTCLDYWLLGPEGIEWAASAYWVEGNAIRCVEMREP